MTVTWRASARSGARACGRIVCATLSAHRAELTANACSVFVAGVPDAHDRVRYDAHMAKRWNGAGISHARHLVSEATRQRTTAKARDRSLALDKGNRVQRLAWHAAAHRVVGHRSCRSGPHHRTTRERR